MGIYEELERQPEPEREDDYGLWFMIFMLVFWPVSLVLGLIDFYVITAYDLRLVNLVLAGLAGWLGVAWYRRREEAGTPGGKAPGAQRLGRGRT
jgi:hypothetical protein